MIRSDEKRLLLVIALAFTILLFLCTGCEMKQMHSGTVTQVVQIDTKSLDSYFLLSCMKAEPEATVEEADECAKAHTAELLTFFAGMGGGK